VDEDGGDSEFQHGSLLVTDRITDGKITYCDNSMGGGKGKIGACGLRAGVAAATLSHKKHNNTKTFI